MSSGAELAEFCDFQINSLGAQIYFQLVNAMDKVARQDVDLAGPLGIGETLQDLAISDLELHGSDALAETDVRAEAKCQMI